ncbi:MAG: hypothetical protein ACOX2O_03895 [Bdellovibrionota bacterium]|jgi:hypothetical protein
MGRLVVIKDIGYQEYKDLIAKGLEAKDLGRSLLADSDKNAPLLTKKSWAVRASIICIIISLLLAIYIAIQFSKDLSNDGDSAILQLLNFNSITTNLNYLSPSSFFLTSEPRHFF